MAQVRVSDSVTTDASPTANADIQYVYECVCMFVNVSKEEDKEDQLVDWFVSATIKTATGNKQSQQLHFPQLLSSCY